MKKFEGYELIYPEGCKEINEELKTDELKRRLTEIMRSLEETSNDRSLNTDYLLNNTESNISETSNLKLEGLLMHFTSEIFMDHEDADVQLRVAVCICNILKLYCPENPFLKFGDSKSRIKIVLVFLTKCLNEMSKLKSKSDKHFLNLYKIFSICCQTNLFHWFSIAEDGEKALVECIRTCFNIVKKFPEWSDDNKPMQLLCDSLIIVIGAHDLIIPDKLVSFLLNFLADRCATKEQKQLSMEIISRCINKLEDQIQSILQGQLIKSEVEEDISDSSDNEEIDDLNDEFCSMPEYKLNKGKPEQRLEKSKQKAQKLDKQKNTIETCVEYSCDHTFQLIYELFKISGALVIPLLPTVEMKLRSPNNVTDRKRACRLLGKLFASYTPSNNNNQSSLWECFLGRFCDIEVEVREICVRVARDVLKKAVSGDDMSGILSMPSSKEDLVKAFQKRSHDQEETIRYQLVLSISQIFESSNSIIVDQELDFVNEMLFKILLDRTRDKCMVVRKEANASLGKLYRRILANADSRSSANGNVGVILGLGNLLPGQTSRLELLLTQILRLYVRVEVEDKIVVERLFNTYLVPYNLDSSSRMKALVQCFTICDDVSLMSIQELFKTQVMIMNMFRETVNLIRDSNSEKVLSPSVSQKLKEKVKRLSEYLPNKDKVESLTKFFGLIRSEKKLFEIVHRLVNPDSHRDVLVKSISEIKRHLSAPHSKSSTESNPANIQKKKAFISTVKCLLERSAPIIMDSESGQELLSLLVSSNEAQESSKNTQDYTISISRALKLLHVISIIYKNSIPTQEAYYYIASIISKFDISQPSAPIDQQESSDDRQSTPKSTNSNKSLGSTTATYNNIPTTIEELCLLALARIIDFRSAKETSSEQDEEKYPTCQDNSKTIGLFSDDSEMLIGQTMKVVQYLVSCATNGSLQPFVLSTSRSPSKHKAKDRRALPLQSEDGDREHCAWKYNSRIAKLATRCLIGLYFCCQQESRVESSFQISEILNILESQIDNLVKNCGQCDLFSVKQTISLSTFTQLGLHLRRRYGTDIHKYVLDTVLLRILPDDNESTITNNPEGGRNLSLWTSNSMVSIPTQVKIQALKMLSKWMVTLKVEEDAKLISSVMVCLRKFIGSYGNAQYGGTMTDGDMAQMRLAAGKCWLRLAQVQSFLSIFDVTWLHRLSHLIYDPCPQVREGFLRNLHKGLFRLQLPLDYMAMFAFVPLVSNPEYLATAKNFFAANVTRRRDFLDRNPQYLTDAKLLFAVLPEYVLAFIIHMLAHDAQWVEVDNDFSIHRVKQCLWFVMEPILKLNENSSFIRKLLEKIKHAQDATDPNNTVINEKLYICCDIALGLLISKQASYDLKEYPVELKLPRTRYIPAPYAFSNPDFANILLSDPPRVLIQFSPTHKSKQMIMNFMPAPLIKGHSFNVDSGNSIKNTEENDHHPLKPVVSQKPKKHVAKIVVGLPEMESEGISCQTAPTTSAATVSPKKLMNIRRTPTKRKNIRSDSPILDMEEFEPNPTSVTKRGRVCKPNIRVMKDMISLSRKSNSNVNSVSEKNDISLSSVRLEGTVSVSLERIEPSEISTLSNRIEEERNSEGANNQSLKQSPKKRNYKKLSAHSENNITIEVSGDQTNVDNSPALIKEIDSPKQIIPKRKFTPKPNKKIVTFRRQTRQIKSLSKPISNNIPLSSSAELSSKIDLNPVVSTESDKREVKTTKIISSKGDVAIKKLNKSSKNTVKKTANISQSTKSPSSTTASTGRTTRSSLGTPTSSNSVTLMKLTKQVLTRRASSVKMTKEKVANSDGDKSKNIIPVLEPHPKSESRKRSTRVNGSLLRSQSLMKPKKSMDSSPKSSPVEIISRSKRMASQVATDQLIKKTKIV